MIRHSLLTDDQDTGSDEIPDYPDDDSDLYGVDAGDSYEEDE